MASINIRIDEELKARAYEELERLGVTPSELILTRCMAPAMQVFAGEPAKRPAQAKTAR